MDFDRLLDQAIEMLQRRGRLTYRTLKRQFDLDDETLEDLKVELIEGQQVATDEKGSVLVWTGSATPSPEPVATPSAQPIQVTPAPQPAPPDAERRQLTVMFCDLVGSTHLSGQLDPEELRDVIRAYQAACNDVVQRFEGYVAQHLGDGLLIYLGYPSAHEDDAQRAVRTSLGIIDAMQALNQRLAQSHGVKLAVRIGIHTGLVVIGDIGAGERREQLALGETPNVAARIQGLAGTDMVVISDATYRLVEGYFECETLGERTLRGVDDSVTVYRVLNESGVRGRLDVALTRGLTPLVGREPEVALLLDRWEQAKNGEGQVVLLSGEAGIGKSRLIQALRDRITTELHTRLECRSSPYYEHTALYPVIDSLHRTLRIQATDAPEERLQKLETALGQSQLPMNEIIPLLAALLSIPIPEDRYESLNLTPQLQRQRTLETLLAVLLEWADQQPLLFVLEDLHWTDPTTLEFLGLVIDQLPTSSILLFLTTRPEFNDPWGSRSYLTQITLNHLSPTQIERLALETIGGKPLPTEVVERIVQQTDGVPLFVEEMTKAVLESGILKDINGQYELVAPFNSLTIPVTLQDSLMARLDRLDTAKGIAQMGAIIGRRFTYELLRAIVPVDETVLQRELRLLVDAELLYQRGAPPHSIYRFKHALIQDAAYQSLLRRTRQEGHQRIVQALETHLQGSEAARPEWLAQHALQGELWDQAIMYFRQAGSEAIAQSAYQEAAGCFQQALVSLQHLDEHHDTMTQGIELRIELRNALMPLGEWNQMATCLTEAEVLARDLNNQSWLGRLIFHQIQLYNIMGEHDHAIEAGQYALVLADSLEDFTIQIMGQYHLGWGYYSQGNYDQAMHYWRLNVNSLQGDLAQQRFNSAGLPAVMSRTMIAWSLAEVGAFDEGISLANEGIEIAQAANQPFSLMHAYMGTGAAYLHQGDVQQARMALERGLALCETGNFSAWLHWITAHLGAANTLAGQVDEAIVQLERGRSANRQDKCYLASSARAILAG